MVDTKTNQMTAEQKLAKIMLKLRNLRPFYSALYEVMERVETNSVPTMGVSVKQMVYNREFVENTPFDELMFINLHEICHIALMHPARRENRDPELWNFACDIYCNAVLASEFGVYPGETVTVNGIEITMPRNSVYCSSIDLDKDYVEDIYEALLMQGRQNGYINDKKGTTPASWQDILFGKRYAFHYTGKKGNYSNYKDSRYWEYKFDINANSCFDIIDNGEQPETKKQQAEKIVQDALVREEMSSSSSGSENGGLSVLVKKLLQSQLDWRKLLRKYLISATSKDSSFSRPDKRMYYQQSIYPGQVSIEDNSIKGVKVCIDTSGSISEEDLMYFCGQVDALMRQYHIQAELIYWDASVQSTGEFSSYREFERVDMFGRGGTDPAVVFDYFDSKSCKVKPLVTLMFTDGYFSMSGISAKQRRRYKDTIWIMTKNHDKNFTPTFGKKAIAKFNGNKAEYKQGY